MSSAPVAPARLTTPLPAAEAPGAKQVAFFCSHTHWDREWYGSFQEFRFRLVRLIDRLLDILDADPSYRCFNLDGQTIVLEDYLEVRPDQRPRLARLIKEGRIQIGPWYILPDEWLVSGESTVRNLLRGREVCREFGVEIPRVGYLPDMFGHTSQIPQLLRGFGMDNTIFWRGVSGDEWKNELSWTGADGSQVLCYHLPEYCGYCNAAFFYHSIPVEGRTYPHRELHGWEMATDDPAFCAEALGPILRRAQEKSTSGVLLLMNGVDHMEAQPEVPEIIRQAQARYPEIEFRHATFSEFIDALREATPAAKTLQQVRGELRATGGAAEGTGMVLPNVISSRMYLKVSNARCQNLLERWAEPFSCIAASLGEQYPAGMLATAWKELLRNHPHDSIGGCSIDAVHRQMETRFEQTEEMGTLVTEDSLNKVATRIDLAGLGADELGFCVFNPLAWVATDLVSVQIDISEPWLRARGITAHPDNMYRSIRNLAISNWDGSPVDFEITDVRYLTRHEFWKSHFVPLNEVVRFNVLLRAVELPALGYKTFRVGLVKKLRRLANRRPHGLPTRIENEHVRLDVEADGTVTLSGAACGGQVLRGLHYFEDGGDNGDGYTYSPPRHDGVATTRAGGAVQVTRLIDSPAVQQLAIDYVLQVPAELDGATRQARTAGRTVALPIRTTFTLAAGVPRIDCETTFTNTAKDHRLRVCFDTRGAAETHDAEMQFDVVTRPNVVAQPNEDVWIEDTPLEQAQQTFVSLNRLAVANLGLPEYEVAPLEGGGTIKLTLLRAVNYLGAGGHANTIVGGAGPHIETPDQQCIGRKFVLRYSLIPHGGDWRAAGVQRQAHQSVAAYRGFGALAAYPSVGTVDGAAVSRAAAVAAGAADAGGAASGALIVTKDNGAAGHSHAGPGPWVPQQLPAESFSFGRLEGDESVLLSALKRAEDDVETWVLRVYNSAEKAAKATFSWHSGIRSARLANLAEEPTGESLAVDAKAGGAVELKLQPKQILTVLLR